MARNYAKALPVDVGSNTMVGSPAPVKALQRFAASAAVSSVITLDDAATQVEVGASGNGVLVRWVPRTETASVSPFASVTTGNFDHYVPAGAVRYFVVPREVAPVTSIVGVNVAEGLYQRVAFIQQPGTAGSVISATY